MSAYNRSRRRYSIKPRFFVFVVAITALLIWGIYIITKLIAPPKIEWGSLATDFDVTAIIIRDEQIISSQEFGELHFTVAEGEVVQAGAEVATLYKSGFSSVDLKNLIQLQFQIKEHQTNNIMKNFIDEDLKYIDSEIDRLIDEVATLTRTHEERKLPAKEREMKVLMEKRRQYMNQTYMADSTLDNLFQREEVLLKKINENKVQITTPASGNISFFLDGLETLLNFDIIDNLQGSDYDLIEDQLSKTSIKSGLGENSLVTINQPIYRVVNPNMWYAIMLVPRSINTLVSGSTCDVRFDGYGDELLSANVYAVKDAGRNVLVILQLNASIESMATLRRVAGRIGRSTEGFKVPINMIFDNNGVLGVYTATSNGTVFIPISVLAQDTNHAIVAEGPGATQRLIVDQKLVAP